MQNVGGSPPNENVLNELVERTASDGRVGSDLGDQLGRAKQIHGDKVDVGDKVCLVCENLDDAGDEGGVQSWRRGHGGERMVVGCELLRTEEGVEVGDDELGRPFQLRETRLNEDRKALDKRNREGKEREWRREGQEE